MQNLWIFGDSFCAINKEDVNPRIWSVNLAKKLNFNITNVSLVGSCQDWATAMIDLNKESITSDDQIIVLLTDPARYWFFQDYPGITNSHVIDFDTVVGKERAKAAEYYFQYIQRPALDIQAVQQRLGWLNYMTTFNKWKKPIILIGFTQFIPNMHEFPDLIFSNGSLTHNVSDMEYSKDMWSDMFKRTNFLKGSDPRYNHLCLQNHEVLTDKLYNTIVNNEPLDLTTGFKQELLIKSTIYDPEFVKNELSPVLLERHLKLSTKPIMPWMDKIKQRKRASQ